MTDLLTINNLVKHFPAEKKLFGKQDYVHAVNNVSLRSGKAKRSPSSVNRVAGNRLLVV